jgi:hypothetical protein
MSSRGRFFRTLKLMKKLLPILLGLGLVLTTVTPTFAAGGGAKKHKKRSGGGSGKHSGTRGGTSK